jgi:hypothetical protein
MSDVPYRGIPLASYMSEVRRRLTIIGRRPNFKQPGERQSLPAAYGAV